MPPPWKTHGTGRFRRQELGSVGSGVVIEETALIFNPSYVRLGNDVYVGHRAMLKGDTRNELVVGDGSWIGEDCYLHSAGGIRIGRDVGLGAIRLPGAHLGDGVLVGAGAVVKGVFPDYSVIAGVPARVLRTRSPT